MRVVRRIGGGLELFEEVASRAGDIDSAGGSALAILDTLDDAGGLGALGTIGALVGIHDLLTVAGLGNLRHDACSPWYECLARALGCLMLDGIRELLKIVRGRIYSRNRRRRTAVVAPYNFT